jgi:hypothetical protein
MIGGEKMNKKIMSLTITVLMLTLMSTPVLAIGPENALGKNPNLNGPYFYGFDLTLRDGAIDNIRVTVSPVPKYDRYKDARYYKINNAIVITDPAQVDELENKWLFMASPIFYAYLLSRGMPEPFAAYLAFVFWPEGVYNKWNFVGQ